MESYRFPCPNCGRTLAAKPAAYGKRRTCPACRTEFTVPVSVTPPPLPPTPTKEELRRGRRSAAVEKPVAATESGEGQPRNFWQSLLPLSQEQYERELEAARTKPSFSQVKDDGVDLDPIKPTPLWDVRSKSERKKAEKEKQANDALKVLGAFFLAMFLLCAGLLAFGPKDKSRRYQSRPSFRDDYGDHLEEELRDQGFDRDTSRYLRGRLMDEVVDPNQELDF